MRNISFKNKLLMGFLFLSALTCAIVAWVIITIKATSQQFESFFVDDITRLVTLFRIKDTATTMEGHILNTGFLHSSPMQNEQARHQEQFAQYSNQLETLLRAYQKQEKESARVRYAPQIAEIQKAFLQTGRAFISTHDAAFANEQAKETARQRVRASREQLHGVVDVIIANELGVLKLSASILNQKTLLQTSVLLLSLVGIILIAVLFSIIFSQKITAPLSNLERAIQKVAAENFDTTIIVTTKDEIGRLGESFNTMVKKLKNSYKELTDARTKNEAILSNIGEGIIAVDASMAVLHMNKKAQEMIGWREQEVIGKPWDTIFRIEDESGITVKPEELPIRIALKGGVVTTATKNPYYYLRKNGTRFPAAIIVTPLRDQTIAGAIEVIRDITEEKRIDEAKTDFLIITSHELRTPLSIILGATERVLALLPKKSKSLRAHQQKIIQFTKYIHDEGVRLLSIVNDFIDVAALESNRAAFHFHALNIYALAGGVLQDLKKTAYEKHLSLNLQAPDTEMLVRADTDRVKEILFNLISNAIQYTEKGGVTITFKQDQSAVKISVSDTGIGIPLEKQTTLFQKFQTINKHFLRSREYGSGMGLYISKLLVEAMGGSISLETSEPGKGSTFSFTLLRYTQPFMLFSRKNP